MLGIEIVSAVGRLSGQNGSANGIGGEESFHYLELSIRRKMRRYIVVFLLACLSVGSSLAAPVSRQAAQQIARNVFSAGHQFAPDAGEISSVIVQKWQGLSVIYAVNFSEGGFVLLSADNRARPVLGICREGAFDPKIHVPAFEWQMEEWSRQIHHIVRNQIPATEKIRQEWTKWYSPQEWLTASAEESTPLHAPKPLLPVVVSPMLTTTWNQGCNYNANCPADGGGSCGRVWTGCGATAMAQCMKFHNWPTTGFGAYSYTPPSYSLQSANFGASTYLFGSMPNNVSSANPAVAQLMHHAGISLDMNYGTTESTCFFSELNNSFKEYFRYSLSTQGRGKLAYTDAQWDVVLRTELDAGRVVPYNGGAHIWVCDGYQTSPDLYHMNWGWGGTYNGYYAQNSLNPGSLTFSTVSCIVGLKPVGPFEVEGDSAVFGENGGTVTVEVAGDSNWAAVASAAWITSSIYSGTEGYFKPILTATANPSYAQRLGYVAFQRGLMRDTVWVRQAGITPRLSATPSPIVEGAAGGSRTITVNCDSNWVVTFADVWIGYAPGAGVGNGSLSITIASNPGAGMRTGTVVFTRGSLTRTVTINQDGTSAFWCVPVLGVPAAVGAINVQVKTLNRTSGIGEGYVLATDSTIFRRDSSYVLRVSFSGSVAPAVWVDWNQDGDFFDTGEAIVAPSGSWYPSFGGTKTTTLSVPSTALLGQTRMRVYVKTFSGGPTSGPCAITNVGDIEDYNVYVQPSTVLPTADFVLSVDESENEAYLRWTWEQPTVAASFNVLRELDGNWQSEAELDGNQLEWQPNEGLQSGRYQIVALSSDGEGQFSNVVEFARDQENFSCLLSPNPVAAGDAFQVQFGNSESKVLLRIFDLGGRVLREDVLSNAEMAYLSTEGWAAGMYLVQVRIKGKVQNLRLLVK